MKKVYVDNDIIILSDKQVAEDRGYSLLFVDGSYVDINSRTITNKGHGDIIIKDLPVWPSMSDILSKEYKFQEIHHLVIQGDKNNIVILPNEVDDCVVSLGGSDDFVMKSYVEQRADCLYIETPQSNGNVNINMGSIWINGRRVPPKLEEDFGYIEIKVPNLHSLSFIGKGTGELFSEIPIYKLQAEIKGAVSLDLIELGEADINISGSGSIKIGTLSEHLVGKISGSGSIDIHDGTPSVIDVSISGSGSLTAGVSVRRARLILSGSGSIFVAEVLEESIEQKNCSGEIRVLKRS